ncbi:MAG: hypothetical protein EOO13_17500 [Chitinophagaceae bacterium]|nr:MAG: hypothetical protein EOO13_17500 [Chitinophagaceae bacterium]
MENWIKVYTTENMFTAEVLKQGLIENDIPAVVLNKQISPYNIGIINVMVHKDNFDLAIDYIKANEI